MSKPSLNHVSVINSSQIRKSCRNSSIFGGSSLTGLLKPRVATPLIAKCYFGRETNRADRSDKSFCTLYKKMESKLAVNLFLLHCYDRVSCC